MGTEAPTSIVIPVQCAPKKAPCPKCGKRGRRKRTLTRTVRTIAYKAIAVLEITYGEYAACCRCCTTFRNTPEGVPAKAKYDDRVRELVLDRLLKDGMSIERALASIRREFLLDLSTGFVYDVLRDRAAELDMAVHRRAILERFSGTLCVDELHLAASRCCWPPTRSPTCRWPSPWSPRMIPITCGGSWGTSRPGGWCPESSSPTARTSTRPCWRNTGRRPTINCASST